MKKFLLKASLFTFLFVGATLCADAQPAPAPTPPTQTVTVVYTPHVGLL
jgi:hypothetical protein